MHSNASEPSICVRVYGTPVGTQCPLLVSIGDCSHMHKATHTQFKNIKIKKLKITIVIWLIEFNVELLKLYCY